MANKPSNQINWTVIIIVLLLLPALLAMYFNDPQILLMYMGYGILYLYVEWI